MARILHSINASITGSCHHEDVVADQEHHEYATTLLKSADAVLLGRKTFELFASFWPQAATNPDLPPYVRDFAVALLDKPKFVVSSKEVSTAWKNTACVKGPSLDAVRTTVDDLPGTVVVFGSPSLASSLASEGLLAEIHVLVQPILVSASPRMYSGYPERGQLELGGVERFRSGVVLLRYETRA
jgi:dihydrofolate reductase